MTRANTASTFDRTDTDIDIDIDAILIDAKQLVLLDRKTAELAREPFDSKLERLAAELCNRHFPWFDADPYASAYRRWFDGAPELGDAESFVLRTRQKALENDEGHRQYWRRAR